MEEAVSLACYGDIDISKVGGEYRVLKEGRDIFSCWAHVEISHVKDEMNGSLLMALCMNGETDRKWTVFDIDGNEIYSTTNDLQWQDWSNFDHRMAPDFWVEEKEGETRISRDLHYWTDWCKQIIRTINGVILFDGKFNLWIWEGALLVRASEPMEYVDFAKWYKKKFGALPENLKNA